VTARLYTAGQFRLCDPPGVIAGIGRGTAAWQESDGERVLAVSRDLSAAGAGERSVFASVPAYVRQAPASACWPRGSTTLASNGVARVYLERIAAPPNPGGGDDEGRSAGRRAPRRAPLKPTTGRRAWSLVGCLFARGAPIELNSWVGDVGLKPAIALSGPLVAYGVRRGVNILDLRGSYSGGGHRAEARSRPSWSTRKGQRPGSCAPSPARLVQSHARSTCCRASTVTRVRSPAAGTSLRDLCGYSGKR
jgi:hypothetical protein